MEIIPQMHEEKKILNSGSPSRTFSRGPPIQIQYYITKRNLLTMRLMAVTFTTMSWVIMLVVCIYPKWFFLESSQRELWYNRTLNFGLWDNCIHCWRPSKLSVYLFISRGIMFLNLVFTSLLIVSMMCSFRRIFCRISNLDFIFSVMNYISGMALFLCVMFLGLQVLDIFHNEGRTFHVKWPFFLTGFGIMSFVTAGTICLNSHRNSWTISYFSPNKLLKETNSFKICKNLKKEEMISIFQELTVSSLAVGRESTISAILTSTGKELTSSWTPMSSQMATI